MAPALLPDPILAIRIALPGPVQLLPTGASSDMGLAGPPVGGASSVALFERLSICYCCCYCYCDCYCALASSSQLELQTGPRG
jgi:hypothetical protein